MRQNLTNTSIAFDTNKETLYGIKLGQRMSGEVTLEGFGAEQTFDTDSGLSLGLFMDQKLGQKMYGGLFLDYFSYSSADNSSTTQYDIGLNLKGAISSKTSTWLFRPGIGIAYGTVDNEDINDNLNFLIINAFLEAIYTGGTQSWLGEIGITSGPTGGNGDLDASFPPTFLIRGGIIF